TRPNALLGLGRALKERGEIVEAIALYRRALAAAPGSVEAANFLGAALLEMGALDEAETVSRALVEQHPDDAPGHSNLGLSLQAQADPAGALAAHRRAVALGAEAPLYWRNLLSALVYAPGIGADESFATHRDFAAAMVARAGGPTPRPAATVKRRPRV